MEYTKKMLLVDPRWVDTAQRSIPDPLTQSLNELDSLMRDILDRQDLVEQDKAHLYQQTLQRYLKRVNQLRGRPLGRVDVTPPEEEEIPETSKAPTNQIEENVLVSVPPTLKKKAEQLLHHLKQNPDFTWNERGEISLQGQTVKNSNLIDLFNDVLRHRKHTEQPTGWDTFATALGQSNVAQELIGHPKRWKTIRSHMPKKEEEEKKTPKKKDKRKKTIWEEM